jgi:hypothetical protein
MAESDKSSGFVSFYLEPDKGPDFWLDAAPRRILVFSACGYSMFRTFEAEAFSFTK